jgi:hypothetical protein
MASPSHLSLVASLTRSLRPSSAVWKEAGQLQALQASILLVLLAMCVPCSLQATLTAARLDLPLNGPIDPIACPVDRRQLLHELVLSALLSPATT